MIKMDFKGIAWVGTVYQKFEAMCLEVEEVIYEDTVKFVENQVQTVGVSVKKFYSEVMQDVLPPSSIDPVKFAAADLSLNPYADFSFHAKPKANSKKDTTSNKPVPEHSIVKVEAKENYTMDSLLKQNRVMASNEKSRGVIKRQPKMENRLTSEVSRDLNRVSTCCKFDENDDLSTGLNDTELCREKGSDSSWVEFFGNVASSIESTAEMISPFESVAKKERQLRDTTAQALPDVSSGEINGADTTDGVDSLIENGESAREDSVSPTSNYNVDFIKSIDGKRESRPETIQEFDKSNCVVVEREDLSVAAFKEDKPRSYKEKIQKAFSSKLLARKQEYKQLAMQHSCMSPKILNEEKSPPRQTSESEWELL